MPIDKRIKAARQIVSYAQGRPYNLSYDSHGRQITYTTENYEYLTWWLGNAPVSYKTQTHILVFEGEHNIKVSLSK